MSIFYFSPWSETPEGGIKQAFRHVEALSEAGLDAHVLILTGDSMGWFESSAPVAILQRSLLQSLGTKLSRRNDEVDWLNESVAPLVRMRGRDGNNLERRITADDIIVLPEFYGKLLVPISFGAKVVIFNQNAHYTFNGVSYADDLPRFLHRTGAVAALAVSHHNVEYLRHAFPGLNVLLTVNGVNVRQFYPGTSKKRQIAFMPRKLSHELVQVIQILRSRGVLQGWTLRPIDGVSEDEVATLLRESAIFLSSCSAEGFGLPPLEAAACACIVVGYCGQAATEFMLPEYCFPIAQGDVLGFARTVEQLLLEYERDASALSHRAHQHAEFVGRRYTREAEAKSVVEAWSTILNSHGAS